MRVKAILLGVAQDGGVPQAGCYCPNCERTRRDRTDHHLVVCLGLVDHTTGQSWLIDATPDFRTQLHTLHQFAPDCVLSGIILTHGHIGHYTGLIHLGPEVMNAVGMPVYLTARMAEFLKGNAPWSRLVGQGHIKLQLVTPSIEIKLCPDLALLPLSVPHRDEFSDTLAYVIRGRGQQFFYCPDIDSWTAWEHDLRTFVSEMDVALLDATFFSPVELPGRDLNQIPHPLVTDTASRLAGVNSEVQLIHLNHSNPLLFPGPEREWLAAHGLRVGQTGAWWSLG